MLTATELTQLTPGQRVSFVYQFPNRGPYVRYGVVEAIKDLGEENVIRNGDVQMYEKNPKRPKGRYLLVIKDETVGGFRSFYTTYIDKFTVLS